MAEMTAVASLDNLNQLQNFIAGQARGILPESRIQQVLLATEEALVNIISYAYPEEAPGDLTVTCKPAPEKGLMICFQDRGKAFNMLDKEAPDLTASLEDRAVGGLGIFFIRQMIDELDYERTDGKNILTFTARPR